MALAGTMAEVPTRGFERVDDLLCEAVFCTSGRQQHLDNLDWLSDGRDGLRVEMGGESAVANSPTQTPEGGTAIA